MSSAGKQSKITLFGNFGRGNFGNEMTLLAMLCNVRKHLPEAEANCICPGLDEISRRYHIAAFPMKEMPVTAGPGKRVPFIRLLRKVLIGVPLEFYRWIKAFQRLRGTDMLVMTGTGMLGDFGIRPFGLHYEILKWSIIGRLCRCKVLFVSVGAGPLHYRLSKWFVKSALLLANYRSYRDSFSKEYLADIGFDTKSDPVYPDLAFSLPEELIPPCPKCDKQRPVVGVGVMTYYNKQDIAQLGENHYHDYVDKLATCVAWLLEHNYEVRLFIGDLSYDREVIQDLKASLKERGTKYEEGQLLDEPVPSVEKLLSQLATTDIVVASRFHNIVFALMLDKPVLSISYHDKDDALMAEVGLSEYCQDIDHLDIDRLIGQFCKLDKDAQSFAPQIRQKTEAYRRALDEQYAHIFNSV